ncbi:MAG: LPP20 family lipoprotein [Kiritimatiellales bacterium]|nr:LPP20 family lipoprotein [Kiritimatiellales bacterium]
MANPKAAYPENQYLVAVGEGDTRRAAENAADANLSRIFESNIESDERMVDQTRESGKAFERTTDFTADINILSSQTLFNIQHAEAWQDQKGRVHAIAYLDRRETAAIYRDKIDGLTARVHFLLAQAEQAADPLKKYAALRAAARSATENDLLLRQLKVIHPPSVASATPGYSDNTIRKALADTAQQIRVRIQVDGDDERRMAAVLEELITRYGFAVGSPAVLDINGRIAVSDTGQRTSGLVFIRYELAVQIKDDAGTVLAAINNKGREAHVSLEEARVRSFRTLETAIKATGAQRLDAYFDSLIDQTPQ